MAAVPIDSALFLVVLYNFVAFALQAPLGVLLDKLAQPKLFIIVSFLLLINAVLLTGFPLVAIILAGLGNALFHVSGGYITLSLSKKIGWLGLFVAPGALGLFFGRTAPYITWLPISLLVLGIVVVALLIPKLTKSKRKQTKLNSSLVVLPAILILLVVCMRSYIGFVAPLAPMAIPLLLTVGVALGKVVGGVIADKIGVYKTAFSSLAIAAILFLFANSSMPIAIMAILFFNMTMPLTLFCLYKLLGESRKGLAFGLTTLALFIGFLPSLLPHGDITTWVICILTLCSCGLFWLFRRVVKHG
jgi:FSR family fosmidomycin resistance protein-like MFS transporter